MEGTRIRTMVEVWMRESIPATAENQILNGILQVDLLCFRIGCCWAGVAEADIRQVLLKVVRYLERASP